MNLVIGSASYNKTVKDKFRKESMALLRKVAKILHLVKGTFKISYNEAGIACSGDATLHADNFYASFSLDVLDSVLIRTCQGQKDYTGGPNRWYGFSQLKQEGAEGLAHCIGKICAGC